MILQYLGTAAAEGIPALFCQCPICRAAQKAGGREIRTRSGAIIDGKLKLDFGPDSYIHMLRHGLDYSSLQGVLITHSHTDHLNPDEMEYRIPGYCFREDGEKPQTTLILYGNEKTGQRIQRFTAHPSHCLAFQRMIPFETVSIGDYQVTALEAVHCQDMNSGLFPVQFQGRTIYRSEEALIYLIEKDGQRILYAHDTCEFTETNMAYLAGRRLDLVSLDCTGGAQHYDYSRWAGHMNSESCLKMRERLMSIGAADENTLFVASHFSHNGYTDFADIQRVTPGFIIAYDGLTLNAADGRKGA